MQFNNSVLVLEQNNYTNKVANAYIFYDLGNWPRNSRNNFLLKYCLFGATNTVKNSNNSKFEYSGYGIAFLGAGSWSFRNDFVRNVVIFDGDNSSSPHRHNYENNFLVLGEGPTGNIIGTSSLLVNRKKESISLKLIKIC